MAIANRRFTLGVFALALLVGGCERRDPGLSIAGIEDLRTAASPELIELLRSGPPPVRARAALAMGRIQSPDYAEPLAAAARRDGELAVRRAALFALGQLGLADGARPPAPAVEVCLELIGEGRRELVADAAEALGKLAPEGAAAPLTALLDHAETEVRVAAVQALFRLRFAPVWRGEVEEPPALPREATEALARTLVEDRDSAPRRLAAHAFSRWGEPAAVDALIGALDDEDEWVRVFAVRALGRSGAIDAADRLVERLADPSAAVRVEILVALTRLGEVARIPPSVGADASHHVRGAYAASLADSRELQSMLEDPSPTVVAAALETLADHDAGLLPPFLDRALEDPRWPVRIAAMRAAGRLGEAGLAWIERGSADDSNAVRVEALRARVVAGDGAAAVIDALSSPDLAMRGTAVELLSGLEAADEVRLLLEAYERSSGIEWVEVRENIVDALERLGQPAPAVEPLSEERSPSPRLGRSFASDPVVVLETDKGTIEILCLPLDAPIHVASFVDLVDSGYYDGLLWHRVVPNFVIQGGDPRGDGWGGAGYLLRDEINRVPFERGTVGMPKAGKDTGGGQIFITHLPTPHLDGNYTVFGRVVSGLDVVDRIEVGDRIVTARVR